MVRGEQEEEDVQEEGVAYALWAEQYPAAARDGLFHGRPASRGDV
eukprot:CAMPEP_0115335728 /NCGR_PEP_ID=MMETSP0270-20121206/88621_1 /TAXON_ID=71861 /ORGANISM="Scrippsiella trochoidea, Strain CCMP3099" /LENGTH=44 /DNA_ID= /DNA_START= /DNA_END= /DNA_ORIENTATION=